MTERPSIVSDLAIEVRDLRRDFGSHRALDEVSFEVHRGEVFGLLGHNGAGKTTLIRVMNGLLEPHGGSVWSLGYDPMTQGDQLRRRTGVLTEYPALDDFLSPVENLQVYGEIHGLSPAEASRRAHELLDRLELREHRDQPARALSAGLKQRVALARALVHDPELLLLDEPTSNLDPLAARGVRDLVLELARSHGRTAVISTHNLTEAQSMCDRVAIIQHGRLLAVGSRGQLGRDLGSGSVHVTVTSSDVVRADPVIQSYLDGTRPAILADGHTFEVPCATEAVPNLLRALVAADVGIESVVPQHPTLEDVYVALHADRTRSLTDDRESVA